MNQELYDKIDDYLDGKLEGESLTAFEQAVATNEELAVEVEVFRLEREGVEILYENDLKHKMNTWNSELNSEKKTDTEGGGGKDIPKPKNGFWLWGGGLLVLAIGGFVWFMKREPKKPVIEELKQLQYPTEEPQKPQEIPKPTNQKPFNPNIAEEKKVKKPSDNKVIQPIEKPIENDPYLALAYEAYQEPNSLSKLRSGDSNNSEPLKPIIEAWADSAYNKVIENVKAVQKGSPVYDRSQEFLGHAYFKVKDFKNAEKVFTNIVNSDNTITVRENAEWYRLLCLISLKKNNEANSLLNKILEDKGHSKNSAAQKIDVAWKKLK